MTRVQLLQATRRALEMHSVAPDESGSGLGWTAKREYLVYDAGTVLATTSGTRSPYTKILDGWTIAVGVINGNYQGDNRPNVLTISTDRDATLRSCGQESGYMTGEIYEKNYLGITWYCNGFKWEYGNRSLITSAPVFDANHRNTGFGGDTPPELFAEIMSFVGARLVPKRIDRPVLTAGR